jgi:hypothetical protein
VFEGDLSDGENPEEHTCQMPLSLLSEALIIPVFKEWAKTLWEAGTNQELIAELTASGETLADFCVHLTETIWKYQDFSKLMSFSDATTS